jgi:hypothetical protein
MPTTPVFLSWGSDCPRFVGAAGVGKTEINSPKTPLIPPIVFEATVQPPQVA